MRYQNIDCIYPKCSFNNDNQCSLLVETQYRLNSSLNKRFKPKCSFYNDNVDFEKIEKDIKKYGKEYKKRHPEE